MLTRRQARQFAYDDGELGPALGWYGNATGGSTTSIIDPVRFAGNGRGPNGFVGQLRIVLPDRVAVDRERMSSYLTLGTGELALDAPALSGAIANGTYYEAVERGLRWDQINAAFFDALREVPTEVDTPVNQLLRDGDLAELDSSAWVVSNANVTLQFSPAADHNETGFESLLLTYGGAVDTYYVQQARSIGCHEGDRLHLAGRVFLLTPGQATFKAWDDTHNLQIGNTITIQGIGYHRVGLTITVPPGCFAVNIRLGAQHGVQVAWDAFPNHALHRINWRPPAYIDANWRLRRFEAYSYDRQYASGWYDGYSGHPTTYRPRIDYRTESTVEQASPGHIQWLKSTTLPDADLFYRVVRRSSDVWAEGEDTPTHCDDTHLLAVFFRNLCRLLETRDRLGAGGLWSRKEGEYDAEAKAYTVTTNDTAPSPNTTKRRLAV